MTHAIPTPSRAAGRPRHTGARALLRRWVSRHLVAMDPDPVHSHLDALEAEHRRPGGPQSTPGSRPAPRP